jgi:hypothetical protein
MEGLAMNARFLYVVLALTTFLQGGCFCWRPWGHHHCCYEDIGTEKAQPGEPPAAPPPPVVVPAPAH